MAAMHALSCGHLLVTVSALSTLRMAATMGSELSVEGWYLSVSPLITASSFTCAAPSTQTWGCECQVGSTESAGIQDTEG